VAGTALTSHPDVSKIFFTGSGGTASKIISATAPHLTPTGFELGGKSARIIFNDADLDSAAQNAVSSILGLSGQQCIAGSRVLVQSGVYDEVLERAKNIVENTPIGDPRDPNTFMGPVISAGAVERIMGFIDRGRAVPGSRVVTGGDRMGGELAEGYFISPTIFADIPNDAELASREIFGPVQSFMKFDTDDEAIAIANDTEYGLAAWVHTTNLARAHSLARDLDAGTVWINGFFDLPVGAPFGGVKKSGFGRLGGIYAIQEFTQPKNVWFPL
jgi:acyl-CoA reductase-like NAD-dependent aldehyde dehydrogenase